MVGDRSDIACHNRDGVLTPEEARTDDRPGKNEGDHPAHMRQEASGPLSRMKAMTQATRMATARSASKKCATRAHLASKTSKAMLPRQ